MAKKKTSRKPAVKRVSVRRFDPNSFLVVIGGGFLIIFFVMTFFGWMGADKLHYAAKAGGNQSVQEERDTLITIQDNTFTSPVSVKKGTKVTWVNNDTSVHTVVADDGSFDLGEVTQNQTKSYVFDTAGTYTYHCSMHEGMTGVIIVE